MHVDAANAILVGAALIDCKCDICRMASTVFRIFSVLWKCKP